MARTSSTEKSEPASARRWIVSSHSSRQSDETAASGEPFRLLRVLGKLAPVIVERRLSVHDKRRRVRHGEPPTACVSNRRR